MIGVSISGFSGRMGSELFSLINQDDSLEFKAGLSKEGCLNSVTDISTFIKKETDLIIDFSLPDNAINLVKELVRHPKPLVSGTTGVDDEYFNELKKLSKLAPVLWSPNMSLGINYLNKIITTLKLLDGFDFQIEETHHRNKVDKPSGTAKLLQNTLEETVGKENCPKPLSIRGGGVFGVHKIYALSSEEVLMFEHTALNRTVFASGAIKVGKWLIKKSPGLYTFNDYIQARI